MPGQRSTRFIARTLAAGLILASSITLWLHTPASAAVGDGAPTDPNIGYVGRWDKSDTSVFNSFWGGAYLRATFTGTTVKIKLASTTDFIAEVDGRPTLYWGQGGTVD